MSTLPFFISTDVAIVWIACLIPLGGCLLALFRRRAGAWAWLPLGLGILLVVPWTYSQARWSQHAEQLGELVQQSRFGEAQSLAHHLLRLDPDRPWNGRAIDRVVAELDAVVDQFSLETAAALKPDASEEDRLHRGRQLAMLGRDAEAIALLERVAQPQSALLIATILQNRRDWRASQQSFAHARSAWERQLSSAEQAEGLAQSIAGIAYCQRKSGDYVQAEASYRELLALAPTAETHFLLAQFYEDSQHAAPAEFHARQAMALAPEQFQQPGEKLISKLQLYHFGCLGVYRSQPPLSR